MKNGFTKIALLLFLLLALVGVGYFSLRLYTRPKSEFWETRIANALLPTTCAKAVFPKFGDLYYEGTLIDTHFHIPTIPDSPPGLESEDEKTRPYLGLNFKIADIVCLQEQENISKVFAFFPVYPGMDQQHVEVVKQTMEKYPNKFVPFIMPPDSDGDPKGFPTVKATELEKMLNVYPGLFKGFGEIGLYEREGGAKELPPDSQRLQEIYPIVRKNKLLVYFHLGEGQKERYEKVLSANPDINFIFHGDQLIQCAECKQTLDEVEDILYNHPNVYYGVDELYGDVITNRFDLTKEQFISHFDKWEKWMERDIETWKGFIERHPNQVLWGTDRGGDVLWALDSDIGLIYTRYTRAFIAKLDPAVQENFAYKNAEKLLK